MLFVALLALVTWWFNMPASAALQRLQVVATYPHDPQAYCQGLVWDEGRLLEGTGQYGHSTLRHVDLATGRVLQQVALDNRYFGEGIAVWGDEIVQLTWRERTALRYDRQTLQRVAGTFRYQGEGWGLTTDGTHLIMSDGTSVLRFLDPESFEPVRRITVRDGRRRIVNLNELEYINGEIYANIWQQDYIVRISPRNGMVLGWIDARGLLPNSLRTHSDMPLNGIAYDAQTGRLLLTGKNWPHLYEVRVVDAR